MAFEDEVHFRIENAPGPFLLVEREVAAYRSAAWEHMIVEFTVVPMCTGEKLLGHAEKFKIPFEVALKGVTTKYGYGADQPRNVRFLGQFLIPIDVQRGRRPFVPLEAAPALNSWQWEAVFNPDDRKGFVARLVEPLAKDWTL